MCNTSDELHSSFCDRKLVCLGTSLWEIPGNISSLGFKPQILNPERWHLVTNLYLICGTNNLVTSSSSYLCTGRTLLQEVQTVLITSRMGFVLVMIIGSIQALDLNPKLWESGVKAVLDFRQIWYLKLRFVTSSSLNLCTGISLREIQTSFITLKMGFALVVIAGSIQVLDNT